MFWITVIIPISEEGRYYWSHSRCFGLLSLYQYQNRVDIIRAIVDVLDYCNYTKMRIANKLRNIVFETSLVNDIISNLA